ncbi:hypothetical protein GMORB2_3841 [Geosmithia morbida]|uniref:Uncharacterized protein n=1 Tax=Geosmithia morbida TaxID=1094350 RepID=A0A9P4Z069_9HYPO|nr:uncharacterized protein GMORB2_3841 [Geosmithia morbida]KAF4125002.1 hypothetical protein GMORB2_3841 [Geosmithia morbida]
MALMGFRRFVSNLVHARESEPQLRKSTKTDRIRNFLLRKRQDVPEKLTSRSQPDLGLGQPIHPFAGRIAEVPTAPADAVFSVTAARPEVYSPTVAGAVAGPAQRQPVLGPGLPAVVDTDDAIIGRVNCQLYPGPTLDTVSAVTEMYRHVPHAFTGPVAIFLYGHVGRIPRRVTVSFPWWYRDIARHWAVRRGMRCVSDDPDLFVLVGGVDRVRTVQFTYTDLNVDDYSLRQGHATARVMCLAVLADELAQEYVAGLAAMPWPEQRGLADDVRWVLGRMAGRGMRFDSATSRNIRTRAFWMPFMLSFPDVAALFRDAGIAVPETARPEDRNTGIPSLVPLSPSRSASQRSTRSAAVRSDRTDRPARSSRANRRSELAVRAPASRPPTFNISTNF